MVARRSYSRGDIFWADLGIPQGSEPGYVRPVVVVSNDPLNHSRLETIIVVPVTTTLHQALAPTGVLLAKGTGGLPKECVAVAHHVLTISRKRLTKRVGALPFEQMIHIDRALKSALNV